MKPSEAFKRGFFISYSIFISGDQSAREMLKSIDGLDCLSTECKCEIKEVCGDRWGGTYQDILSDVFEIIGKHLDKESESEQYAPKLAAICKGLREEIKRLKAREEELENELLFGTKEQS